MMDVTVRRYLDTSKETVSTSFSITTMTLRKAQRDISLYPKIESQRSDGGLPLKQTRYFIPHMNKHTGIMTTPTVKSVKGARFSLLNIFPGFACRKNRAGKIYTINGEQVDPMSSITGPTPGAAMAIVVVKIKSTMLKITNR